MLQSPGFFPPEMPRHHRPDIGKHLPKRTDRIRPFRQVGIGEVTYAVCVDAFDQAAAEEQFLVRKPDDHIIGCMAGARKKPAYVQRIVSADVEGKIATGRRGRLGEPSFTARSAVARVLTTSIFLACSAEMPPMPSWCACVMMHRNTFFFKCLRIQRSSCFVCGISQVVSTQVRYPSSFCHWTYK